MNKREEDLTPENIDERIELFRYQRDANPPTPLRHVIRDLQRVYDEEQQLEHIWKQISSRVQSLDSTTRLDTFARPADKQPFQEEQKVIQQDTSLFTHPGGFQSMPDGRSQKKHSPHRRWLNISMGLAAAIVVMAALAWLVIPTTHGIGTGSGHPTPTVVPTPWPAATPTATPTPSPTPVPATPTSKPTPVPATPVPKPTPVPATPTPTPAPNPTPVPATPTAILATPTATPTPGR